MLRFHPLAALLLLAAAIRLPLAFWPNVLHPDEIFQSLEPAWRMLGHDGIIPWEWRYGMRGWLLPTAMAGPVALGDWFAPGGTGAFVTPRLVAALVSLSIVGSAWCFGARVSRTHAITAAFVAAIWFEFVCFAPHTLSEPLATALILPAALLLTPLSQRHLVISGGLLALAVVFRFQYAPAIAVLTLGACYKHWRNLLPLIAGGSIALLFSAVADAAHGVLPFAWLIANIQQNFLHDRAAEFGVTPAITYLYSFWMMWSVAIIAGAWALLSGALAATGAMPDNWMRGTGEAQLAAELRADPALCGLALYITSFHLLPGQDRLVGRSPLYAFHPADPLAGGDLAPAAREAAPAFNRILSRRDLAADLPAGFSQRNCASVGGADVCIFARSGTCDAAAAPLFLLNEVLVRVDR